MARCFSSPEYACNRSKAITAAGFPVFRLSEVHVVTEGTVRTDVQLQLSQVATQIEVSATAAAEAAAAAA